jgi:predicted ArsR family transcriptional regulator
MRDDDEVELLRELLLQKERALLASRAGLATAVVDHFGEEAEEVIKTFLREGARDWAAKAAEADRQANRRNDIQGLMNFLWEPLRREGFEFTYEQDEQGCQMKVTRCPVAEMAKALKLEKWGYIFHCMGDEPICEGYNPEMAFKRTKTLMEGADYCDHFYYYREQSKNTDGRKSSVHD